MLLYNHLQIQAHCQRRQAQWTTKRLKFSLDGRVSQEKSQRKNGKGILLETLGSRQQWPAKEQVGYKCVSGLAMQLLLNITPEYKANQIPEPASQPLQRCERIHLPRRVAE